MSETEWMRLTELAAHMGTSRQGIYKAYLKGYSFKGQGYVCRTTNAKGRPRYRLVGRPSNDELARLQVLHGSTHGVAIALAVSSETASRWLKALERVRNPLAKSAAPKGGRPSVEELARLQVMHGSCIKIGRALGVTSNTASAWLKDAGLKVAASKRPKGKKLTRPSDGDLHKLYAEHRSTTAVGRELGVSQRVVHVWCKAAGVKMRPVGSHDAAHKGNPNS